MICSVQLISVVGPTGTGKSALALELAQALGNCEIVNADAFSQYRGMDIGTAKIMPAERMGIPHHLIDNLDPLETSTIADFQVTGRMALADIMARGKKPIVVGGSGLYVRALLDEMDLPGTNAEVRAALQARLEIAGLGALYSELHTKDLEAAYRIGPHNARRIIRALEVIAITGKPYSASLPSEQYLYPTIAIGLDFNRAALDARIDLRVERMREQGLLDEVRGLASDSQGGYGSGLGATAARAIGYAELLPVLRGEFAEDAAFTQIAANTKRLTRKQMGWFGRDPRVTWLDGGSPDLLKQALSIVQQGGDTAAPSPRRRTPLGSISAAAN